MAQGDTYPAQMVDSGNGEVRLDGSIVFTDDSDQPASLSSGVFANVDKPTISNATAADIIAALVTLNLVVDDT